MNPKRCSRRYLVEQSQFYSLLDIIRSHFNFQGMLYNLQKKKLKKTENELVMTFSNPSVYQWPLCTKIRYFFFVSSYIAETGTS